MNDVIEMLKEELYQVNYFINVIAKIEFGDASESDYEYRDALKKAIEILESVK